MSVYEEHKSIKSNVNGVVVDVCVGSVYVASLILATTCNEYGPAFAMFYVDT